MKLSTRNRMIKRGLQEHGIIVHTLSDFSYTTGMTNFGFPEIIITCMSKQTRGGLCNYYFHKWADKGVNLKNIESLFEKKDGSDAAMRFVTLEDSKELLDDYVAQTICYYEEYPAESPVMFVHLQIGDDNDHFPDSNLYDSKNIPQKVFAARKLN